MNEKSMTASCAGLRLDRRRADHHRVAEPGRDLGLRQPLRVGTQVEEPERVLGAELGRLLMERSFVRDLRDPVARADREVVAALLADAEVLPQLVVAVVRAARRARVRVLALSVGRFGPILVLDGDVDSGLGHGASDYR